MDAPDLGHDPHAMYIEAMSKGCNGSSSGSRCWVKGGRARNMKSMWPPSTAIFFITYFYRAGGGGGRALSPPGSATGYTIVRNKFGVLIFKFLFKYGKN